jgi:hypothetical protein
MRWSSELPKCEWDLTKRIRNTVVPCGSSWPMNLMRCPCLGIDKSIRIKCWRSKSSLL